MKNAQKIINQLCYVLLVFLIATAIYVHRIDDAIMVSTVLYYMYLYHKELEKPKTTNITAENVNINIEKNEISN